MAIVLFVMMIVLLVVVHTIAGACDARQTRKRQQQHARLMAERKRVNND